MNELSLFSGAGGGLLGSKLLGWTCVGYVEKNDYCQRVLRARIRDGFLDDAPIFDDVRTFDGLPYRGRVDIVTAGFPCQPFSLAGKQRADADERNMWPDTIRIVREVRPRFALLENVPGLLTSGYFGTILKDISESGLIARWAIISAAEAGAPHIRARLWLVLADSNGERGRAEQECERRRSSSAEFGNDGLTQFMAHASSYGLEEREETRAEWSRRRIPTRCGWWTTEPAVGRVAHGLAGRVVQLRALGNGQVPRVVVEAWRRLNGF